MSTIEYTCEENVKEFMNCAEIPIFSPRTDGKLTYIYIDLGHSTSFGNL